MKCWRDREAEHLHMASRMSASLTRSLLASRRPGTSKDQGTGSIQTPESAKHDQAAFGESHTFGKNLTRAVKAQLAETCRLLASGRL